MRLKILAALGMLFAFSAKAHASIDGAFAVGYSSMAVVGFRCSTGTVSANIFATRPTGFTLNVAGYRIINQDTNNAVWIGGPLVSTDTAIGATLANLGEKIPSGSNGNLFYQIGKQNTVGSGQSLVQGFCKAADAAGPAGVPISVSWFGY